MATVFLLCASVALTSCTGSPDIGELTRVDGGAQIVVPALWANGETGHGGIEPATIWVDTHRTSDQLSYEVNLSDVKSKGGGAMWQAATSSAAAIGALFSGFDPDNIAYRFDITGPIDGPSAGGILTVGVLAAINNHSLLAGTTMTGTIAPDGSIGPVGLVALKLSAAAEAGYQRVLIPAAVTTVADPDTGKILDTQAFGKTVGVDVIYVHTLEQAYFEFTGEELDPSSQATTAFDFARYPALREARQAAAQGLLNDTSRLTQMNPEAPSNISSQLSDAQKALNLGDPSTAFGLSVDALELFATWDGERSIRTRISEIGETQARIELTADARENMNAINLQMENVILTASSLGVAEQLALPGALGWLTYAHAVLESMVHELEGRETQLTSEALVEYAGLAEQVKLESSILFPHILAVLDATPDHKTTAPKDVASFMSGYSNFLIVAGNANLTYLESVLGLTKAETHLYSVVDLIPVAAQLSDEAASIPPEVESIGLELEESSIAMTYFVVTMSLISSVERAGTSDIWLSPQNAILANEEQMKDSIEQSLALVEDTASLLQQDDMNAGFPLWSAQWGSATFEALAEQDRAATGASIALNEIWYDVITVLSMRAYAQPE